MSEIINIKFENIPFQSPSTGSSDLSLDNIF